MAKRLRQSLLTCFLITFLSVQLLTGCRVEAKPTLPSLPTLSPLPTETQPAVTLEAPVPTWDGSEDLSLWQGGSDYLLEARGRELYVQANKVTNTAYMEATFPAIDIRQSPYASLEALADISANITIGLIDGSGDEAWLPGNSANREMAHGTHPMVHSFDFSKLPIDLTQVTGMRIAFNRNSPVCSANVVLRNILLGSGAVRGLNYAPLPDVEVTPGDTTLPVALFPLGKENAGAAWNAQFPAELITAGEFVGDHFMYSLTGQSGSGTVTLAGERDGKRIQLAFNLTVVENQPPDLNPIAGQILAVDTEMELRLTGLDDGDPSSAQPLRLTAASQDSAIASVGQITFDGVSRWAKMKLKAGAAGRAQITLTLTDDRGLSTNQAFEVAVFSEINQPPAFDAPEPVAMYTGSDMRLLLGGITGGEAGQQVTFTVASDTGELAVQVVGEEVILHAAENYVGDAIVTITATDDGGNERNQGNASITHRLPVSVIQPPITGLSDTFDGPQVNPALAGSGEGAHTLSIDENVLRVEVDKYATNNQWAGLWYPLSNELNLSANPVITLRLKADKETSMLIFLWDANDVYNTAGTATARVGTEWQEYTFDFSGKNLDADGKTVDFTRIKALLINFAPGLLYKGTFWLDDLSVGSESKMRAAATPLQIHTPLQFILLSGGSLAEQFPVTGLQEGDQVELIGVDPAFLASAEASLTGSDLLLQLLSAPGAAGFTRLKVAITGQEDRKTERTLDVILVSREATSQIVIDPSVRYQTIDGFGAFLGSGVWDQRKQALALPFVQDLGITIARFGIINNDFEHRNDNANPYVIDYSAFDLEALPLAWMRRLKQETGIDKYVLTVWSPPAWMKKSRTLAASTTSGENFVEERYYEEYAEFLVAVTRIIKEQTDIDLYAISIQNEPQFNEPYASALLSDEKMALALKVVTARFAAEGFQTKFYMPEALPQQKGIEAYIRQLDLTPETRQRVDIIAIHNYDGDGIHVGGAGAREWADLYAWANAARPRQIWMTETSGHPDNWTGAKVLFGNLYNALVYGKASAWIWWTLAETSSNAEFGLVVDNQASSRFAISRHFYRAVQPGAVRVETSSEPDLLSVAFQNPDGTLTVVLFNTGQTRLVSCSGAGMLVDAWVSQDGFLSRPAQVDGQSVLLPKDSAATLIYK